ncbi:TetR/AcrR family transcriptional regulator [Pseudonocardia broussonetiae]|uniref:TetR/AcrR family transcriptional regulator n=1 Tax=Pseudonocardia broussonetiae TaxID=2736640 RepID=A0A6M6JUL3_9PSEU|nr:TetR/AcrR family transcriptional regulator [Pseudonocardia broussonetiae]QJY51160.1 TetR/AcrR family transcriptional regulator [Pseudonocardia broussonetiae]
MSVRERVLDALQELILGGDPVPSLDAVAAAAGVSKGGLLHHFRDRRALAHGLVHRALAEIDAAMTAAAAQGSAAETWLRLSAVDGPELVAARALLSLVRVTASGIDLPPEVAQAVARWQAMITTEIGDPVRGDLVRLVGDGLFLETLAGDPPNRARVDALVGYLLAGR